jgi:hypothetical protein
MTAATGGFLITGARWIGNTAIRLTLSTAHTGRYFQLYAGRRLIGVTNTVDQTEIIGQLQPAHCPHCLTVVMVEEGEQATDYGAQLATRPFNQFQMAWQADSFPADAKWFELTAATAAGGAVDAANVVARIAYQGDGDYEFLFPPITEPGDWSYKITPRDDANEDGNAGDATTITETALPYPPDILTNEDDTRMAATVLGTTLTVDFDYDWDA